MALLTATLGALAGCPSWAAHEAGAVGLPAEASLTRPRRNFGTLDVVTTFMWATLARDAGCRTSGISGCDGQDAEKLDAMPARAMRTSADLV